MSDLAFTQAVLGILGAACAFFGTMMLASRGRTAAPRRAAPAPTATPTPCGRVRRDQRDVTVEGRVGEPIGNVLPDPLHPHTRTCLGWTLTVGETTVTHGLRVPVVDETGEVWVDLDEVRVAVSWRTDSFSGERPATVRRLLRGEGLEDTPGDVRVSRVHRDDRVRVHGHPSVIPDPRSPTLALRGASDGVVALAGTSDRPARLEDVPEPPPPRPRRLDPFLVIVGVLFGVGALLLTIAALLG